MAQVKEIPLGKAPAASPAASARETWDGLVDDVLDSYFRFHPTGATSSGVHQYDRQLEGYSRAGVQREIAALQSLRARVAATRTHLNILQISIGTDGRAEVVKVLSSPSPQQAERAKEKVRQSRYDPAPGGKPVLAQVEVESDEVSADRDLLLGGMDSSLLELETVRMWERNPDSYSSGITNAIFVLISRKFAPPAERLRAVIARERQIPAALEAARANLKGPPKIYTDIALLQLPGIIRFFQNDVPAAFKEVTDQKLLAEFQQANAAVIDALAAYQSWLRVDLLPRSTGDFRLGAELYRQKLFREEMVDTPLDELLKIGYADLRRNQQQFKAVAARIDPAKTPEQILEEMQRDHPPPDKLLQSFRDVLGGLREFIEKKRILTIPSPVPPSLEETPPFMRALTFASMDTPGPFETRATEAFFNVTLPEPDWPAERVAEHMAGFNWGTIISTAIHEAYPGHYVQFLWVQHAPSKARKIFGAGSNSEGWAHYTEQMMLDEGYGRGPGGEETRDFLKLRLGQLQDALLRNARFIAGIEMHTGKMTYEQGIDFFVKEGYQSRTNAERETMRGTGDPTYLIYTLGKLQILKLRDDYRKLRGDQFSLQEFHDSFLKQGFPPIKMVRKAMLGEAGKVM